MVSKGEVSMSVLFDLLNLIGVSGSESKVRKYIQSVISPYVDEIKVDKMGNLIARKKGTGPSVMLAAHMDEVGLMIKNIHLDGRIEVTGIGAVEVITLVGETVEIISGKKKIEGVISTKNISRGDEEKNMPKMEDIFIDTCLDKKKLESLGVKVGDSVTFKPRSNYLNNKDLIVSKAIDDRVGCFILIELAKKLKSSKNEIYYVFTVQEEVGLYGAKTSSYSVKPDWGIAVDVIYSEDYVDDPNIKLGDGPVLTLVDSDIISNKHINELIEKAAKKCGIKIQRRVSNMGTTDATDIAMSRGGVPSTVLGIAIKNIHSAIGIASLKDTTEVLTILTQLLRDGVK